MIDDFKFLKIMTGAVGVMLSVGLLAGCTAPAPAPVEEIKSDETTEIEEVAEPEVEVEAEEPKAEVKEAGAVLNPGDSAVGSGTITYRSFDDRTAEFSHSVVSVEPVDDATMKMLVDEIPELKNYDAYTVNIESNFVSGENLEFDSFSVNFKPVDPDKDEVQSVAVIGYDFCKSNSIPKPGNDPATVINNCVLGVVPKGTPAPAGIAWAQSDTGFSIYNGSPAYIMLP